MNPDLEKLVHLHHVESELGRVESELADIPRFRKELATRLDAGRERLDAAKADLEASQKTRKAHESAVQDLETKRSKYKGQLMEVKTNKEYTAMLHEIEAVEREIRSREDQILEEMEKAEVLVLDIRREEAAFKIVEQEAKTQAVGLDAREAKLAKDAGRLLAERDEVAASVPEDPLHTYHRVAKLRGTGVAEAKDGMCQACRMKLRLQVWVELRKNEALYQCESCSRVLYYEPPPPTVALEP